jgi:hypothetical protein
MKINRPKLCECGCGQTVRNRFVQGHTQRNKIPHNFGKRGEYHHSEKTIKRMCESRLYYIISEETKKKIGESNKERYKDGLSEDHIKKLSISHMGQIAWNKGMHFPKERRRKDSVRAKNQWKNPDFVSKQMKARGVMPNKTELWFQNFLNSLYPNEWKFVGDGQVIIAGKCPDFINVNGQKKIIELFGDYWHRNQDPQDRIDIFKPYGYKTLIIWENELKDMVELRCRLERFSNEIDH